MNSEVRYGGIKKIDYAEFKSLCDDDKKVQLLVDEVSKGIIYVIREVITPEVGRAIIREIVSSDVNISNTTRIEEGIQNIRYLSSYKLKKANEYSANDMSWYFFPWNKDDHGVLKNFLPIFDYVLRMNGYEPSIVRNNTPKNGLIERIHLINYPFKVGEISMHIDPINLVKINCGIYLTEYGLDYGVGGFKVLDPNGKKIHIDPEIKCGDMVLFYPALPHMVDTIQPLSKIRDGLSGRFFITHNVVQSHIVNMENRVTAKGFNEA
jgi:hypothetical protein